MSEYKSPHNDGHEPYILIWEYGSEVQRARFVEKVKSPMHIRFGR